MNTKVAPTHELVTDDDYRAEAHAIRAWIEQQVSKPEALAALAAAAEQQDLTLSEHPFERLALLDILIRQGKAPGVSPERLPNFRTPPAWARESSYRIAFGCGSIEITFHGQPHGEDVPVTVTQDVEIVLWPDLYDAAGAIGDHHTDGPALTWSPYDAEELATKGSSGIRRFTAALAAATDELAGIEALASSYEGTTR